MTRQPRLTAKEAIQILESNGFLFNRQSGSHKIYKRADGKRATVPFHGSKIIKPKTLKMIFKDTGINLFNEVN